MTAARQLRNVDWWLPMDKGGDRDRREVDVRLLRGTIRDLPNNGIFLYLTMPILTFQL